MLILNLDTTWKYWSTSLYTVVANHKHTIIISNTCITFVLDVEYNHNHSTFLNMIYIFNQWYFIWEHTTVQGIVISSTKTFEILNKLIKSSSDSSTFLRILPFIQNWMWKCSINYNSDGASCYWKPCKCFSYNECAN